MGPLARFRHISWHDSRLLMLLLLGLSIVCGVFLTASSALAQSTLPAWSKIGVEWNPEKITDKRILFTSRKGRSFISVTEFESDLDPDQAEAYFKGTFAKTSVLLRKHEMPELADADPVYEATSFKVSGTPSGQISTAFNFEEQYALLTERVWFEKGKMWHIQMMTWRPIGPSTQAQTDELDAIENLILSKHTARHPILELLIGEDRAHAGESVRSRGTKSGKPLNANTTSTANTIIPECKATGLKTENMSPGPRSWIRFDVKTALKGCGNDIKQVWPKFKKTMLDEGARIEKKTGVNIEKLKCEEFNSQKSRDPYVAQIYSNCLESAGSTAIASEFWDAGVVLAQQAKHFVDWARVTDMESAIRVMSKKLAQHLDGYTCLNPERQAEVFCKAVVTVTSGSATAFCMFSPAAPACAMEAATVMAPVMDFMGLLKVAQVAEVAEEVIEEAVVVAEVAAEARLAEVAAATAKSGVGQTARGLGIKQAVSRGAARAAAELDKALKGADAAVLKAAKMPVDKAKVSEFVEDFRKNNKVNTKLASELNDAERLAAAQRLSNKGRFLTTEQKKLVLAMHQVCEGGGNGFGHWAAGCIMKKARLCVAGVERGLFGQAQCKVILASGVAGQLAYTKARSAFLDDAHKAVFDRKDTPVSSNSVRPTTAQRVISETKQTTDPKRLELGAQNYYHAATDHHLDDITYFNAFHYSMQGEGTVARGIAMEQFKKNPLDWASQMQHYGWTQHVKDPASRKTIRDIITDMQLQPEWSRLSAPQQSELMRGLSNNAH